MVEWYTPTIGNPEWDIQTLNREERNALKECIVMGIVHTEEEYQTVIGYMYKKFPHLMDITGTVKNPITGAVVDNTSIQWNYTPWKNKTMIHNEKDKISKDYDMYAFIYYDKERDYEPIYFAGSYFKNLNNLDTSNITYDWENLYKKGKINTACGEGYVAFCDPFYRRLGLGSMSWIAESQLYRDSDMEIPLQMEIQNEYSVKSTLACFPPSDKYPNVKDVEQLLFGEHNKHLLVTSNGRVKNDGTHCQIRLLMNYLDDELVKSFNEMPENMKNIYGEPHWNFLNREKFSKEELIKPWCK